MLLRDSYVPETNDTSDRVLPWVPKAVPAVEPKGLRKPRIVYAPFEYQKAYDYWHKQQCAHWLHTEINLAQDLQDWSMMSSLDKHVVGSVLKGFVQAEVVIGDYWSTKVSAWFPKPEIALMCGAFAAMEGVHQTSYAYLGDTLGLDDYKAFLEEPTARSKIDRLVSAPRDASDHDVAVSLASFSAFGEGVSLFSSFAVLLHFSTRNMLKGTGQIISFSIRDESLHSEAGCWLFKEFMAEDPSLFSKRLTSDIKEVARETVRLEENAIDQIFAGGSLGSFTPDHLKAFIKLRANKKLQEIGIQSIFGKIDEQEVARTMGWFDAISAGREHADFFATRVTEYGTTDGNWEEIW